MRILKYYAENVLNLKAVEISSPNPRKVTITGKNGAGKSNVLQAMFYALAGKGAHAHVPIRRGTQRATVRLELGDTATELTIMLRITASGPKLDIEAPNGAVFKKKPQQMLNDLFGQLTFDPSAFPRLKPEARLELLRSLVKLDIDVDALDGASIRDREARTAVNHQAVSARERVTTLAEGVNPLMEVGLIDISALTQEMAEASARNTAIATEQQAIAQLKGASTAAYDRATTRRAQADELRKRAAALDEEAKEQQTEGDTTLAEHGRREKASLSVTPTDVSALREQINEALKENSLREQQVRTRQQHEAAVKDLDTARATSDALTAAIERRTNEKESAMARANMPIAGLGFGDGDVTYDGLPFAQASTGQQLRIGVAIGMALNPKLRVLCIRDGANLDEDSLAILEAMAEEHDFQLWIESTQKNATVGIHIVDGAIAAIDGEPVPETEEEAVTA